MRGSRRRSHPLLGMVAGLVFATPGFAGMPPHITTRGTAELRIAANEAAFSIGIVSEGASGAVVGAANARLTRSVLDRLHETGLLPADVRASRVSVHPRWVYDRSVQRPRAHGFEATRTIDIDTHTLARIGAYIDAALSAGATSISPVQFSASDQRAAQLRALAEAVADARAQAQTAARAAGGELGALISLDTSPAVLPRFAPLLETITPVTSAARRVATQISPQKIRIVANVVGRWRFVTGKP